MPIDYHLVSCFQVRKNAENNIEVNYIVAALRAEILDFLHCFVHEHSSGLGDKSNLFYVVSLCQLFGGSF